MTARRGLLDGVVVLDFTRAVAGPYATRLLCDMGATVLKIEPPERGDGIRGLMMDHPTIRESVPPAMSPVFIYCNAGKYGLSIDLKEPEGIGLVKRLIPQVDVVIENFTPHVMPSLGLSYDELRRIKPEIIMCSLTGFGQDGPMANDPCVDYVAQAVSGMASLSVDSDGYPVCANNSMSDTISGLMAAMAILSALFNRERTGEGEYIDVSMIDSMMGLDANGHTLSAATRGRYQVQPRPHRHHFIIDPFGVYRGPEGRFFTWTGNWPHFCELSGHSDLAADPAYADPVARAEKSETVHRYIEEFLQSFATAEDAWQVLRDARVSAGMVMTPWELQNHPQMATRDMVRDVAYPTGTTIPTIATPPHFRNHPISVGRAPFLGEHNRSVLGAMLDLSEAELERLHGQGVLWEGEAAKELRADGAAEAGAP